MNRKLTAKWILLIVAVLIVGGSSVMSQGPQPVSALGEPDPLIEEIIAQVDADTVYLYDGNLSGENEVTIGGQPYTLYTRYSYSGEPVQKATQFVYEHFENLGLDVEYHNYTWSDNNWRNVVATKPGLTYPDDIYIICAHVDSRAETHQTALTNAPGADDNASGVTAVMIAADILSQYDFDYTIRFVTFTGEEQGLYGSHYYAQDAYYEGDDILGVLNLDMIAYDSDADSIIELHAGTGADSIAIANLFADVVDTYDINLVPEIITAGATNRSDHASFWDYGYDAILAIEDWQDFTPYYHTTNDQLSTLNMPYFTEFVKASVGTIASMSSPLFGEGYLEGTVTDASSGDPLLGVTVTIVNQESSAQTTAGTDSSGYYTKTLSVGLYDVTAEASGYYSQTASGVEILADEVTTQDFALERWYRVYVPLLFRNGFSLGGRDAICWLRSAGLNNGDQSESGRLWPAH